MSRRIWVVFVCVQSMGQICFWTLGHVPLRFATTMWGTALISLFPGNFASGALIEKLLWGGGRTLTQMALIEAPLEIAINAVVWFLCATLLRFIGKAWFVRRDVSPPDPNAARS